MADCGSDVEFKNDKNTARKTKTLAIDVNYDFVTSFWRAKAVVTSHFAARTLTDFLAKAQLLDRDVNLTCRLEHNGCIYKQIVKTVCFTWIWSN